jgi:hypothetical protein
MNWLTKNASQKAMELVNLVVSWMKHAHLYSFANVAASSPSLNVSMEFIINALPEHRIYDEFIAFYTSYPVVSALEGRM